MLSLSEDCEVMVGVYLTCVFLCLVWHVIRIVDGSMSIEEFPSDSCVFCSGVDAGKVAI